MIERYVYVIIETVSNNWDRSMRHDPFVGYNHSIVGVFDTYELAEKCMDKWEKQMSMRKEFKYVIKKTMECSVTLDGRGMLDLDMLPLEDFPFNYDYEVTRRRQIYVEVLETEGILEEES